MRVLIIEDEKVSRISLANTIRKEGFEVASASTAEEGLEIFEREQPAVVVTDLRLPKASGMHVLSTVLARSPECKVIIITAYATVETAVAALRQGAYDYLTKPFSPERLLSLLRNLKRLMAVVDENRELRSRIRLFEDRPIIGSSPPIRRLVERVELIAQSDSTILLEGESGTGKEIIARAIHQASPRRTRPFVAVTSAGIPESLLETELFGHEKGSFTGAVRRHTGYFERAGGGTLFLDDIDDLPMAMQVKLLRVLQEREVTRVGGSESISIDVRIIAATKVSLLQRVAEKGFREDLFYRLNILPLQIPPLRDRKEDIPLLVDHFLRKHGAGESVAFSEALMARCLEYDWPGNVRELENLVERVVALSKAGPVDPSTLGWDPLQKSTPATDGRKGESYPGYEEYMLLREREIVGWALQTSANNISEAARLLKIPRTTLMGRIPRLFPALDEKGEQRLEQQADSPAGLAASHQQRRTLS